MEVDDEGGLPFMDDIVPTAWPGEFVPAVTVQPRPRTRARLRELHGYDRLQAARKVVRWRFPREVYREELVLGHWFEWGSGVVFWLLPDYQLPHYAVHLASAPGSREARYLFDWQAVLLVIGDLLGADAIYAQPIPGSAAERALRPHLRRLGWRQQGARWYLSLSGGGVGIETSQDGEASPADQQAGSGIEARGA